MSSPETKRVKYDSKNRMEQGNTKLTIQKRLRSEVKTELELQKELQTLRKKNFVISCEKVSCEAYFNRQKRLQIVDLPTCAKGECTHSVKNETPIRETPTYAKKSFNIEVNTGMWYDALEVCQVSITYDQYLSAEVMKEIIEIMLNVHDDIYVNYTVEELIDKCQQVLALNFSTHPPCPMQLRKCYRNFLTTPMDLRENTFTDRNQFGCGEGIVKYCMNRLEADIRAASKDEAIINKYENTPSEMKEGVQGLHWQKEKFEIFELLERPERIKRLMAVLESIIELLQYDLAIWQTRYTSKMGTHIMEQKNKPLLAFILWHTSPLNTGAVTRNCRQIIELFIYFIHLQYPEEHIQVMTTWLNTIIETFYICETNSNSDFPNLGKYCYSFATKFYESMISREKCLSNDSMIKILERIQPSFMRYLIGMHMTKSFLGVLKEDNIIRILIDFIKKRQWEKYPKSGSDNIQVLPTQTSMTIETDEILLSVTKSCNFEEECSSDSDSNNNAFPKFFPPDSIGMCTEQNHVVHVIYITLEALLDVYSVQTVQDTLDDLNEKLQQNFTTRPVLAKPCMYSVSEDYIKKYRTIYQNLKELIGIILDMKEAEEWPKVLQVFNNISILG